MDEHRKTDTKSEVHSGYEGEYTPGFECGDKSRYKGESKIRPENRSRHGLDADHQNMRDTPLRRRNEPRVERHELPKSKTRKRFLIITTLILWASAAIMWNDVPTFPDSFSLKDGQTFDYIVVGSGASGTTVAARLALANKDLLLIEAGGDPNILTKVPGTAIALLGSRMDWQYRTIPNNVSCLSSVGQQCRFSRGKCLGGSTSINYMLYTRGNRERDFEEIPFPGWTFKDLMPYFPRYEVLQNPLPHTSRQYHNTTGTMRVGYFNDPENPWHSRLITSFRSLNFPYNNDMNAESQIGVSKVLGYVHQGLRMSTARVYLTREDVKRKLKVAKNTMCTGVIIDNDNIARGVSVIQGSKSIKLYARKEVILSAGAIGTPQILMLSGVGPADHLQSMGIPVKVNLPVGNEMSDHALPLIIIQVPRSAGITHGLKLLGSTIRQLGELIFQQTGALTSNGLTDASAFANIYCYDFARRRLTNESSDGSDCEVPNLQIINAYIERYLIPYAKSFAKQTTGLNDDVVDQMSEANMNYSLILMSLILLTPRSVGSVRLSSRDPLAPPAIYPNYLSDEKDVDDMVRSINIVEDLVTTPVFKRHQASLLRLRLAGCPTYEAAPLEYWRCYVRHMTYSVYHAAGTAPLGPVLDERLRVHDVKGLRVADLSALPKAPRGNTAAAAIAIGERLAHFILDDTKR